MKTPGKTPPRQATPPLQGTQPPRSAESARPDEIVGRFIGTLARLEGAAASRARPGRRR